MILELPVVLEAKYGALAWNWFTASARKLASKYTWIDKKGLVNSKILASLVDLDEYDDPDDISDITDGSQDLQDACTLKRSNHYNDNGTINTQVFCHPKPSNNSSTTKDTLDKQLNSMVANPEIEQKMLAVLANKMIKKQQKRDRAAQQEAAQTEDAHTDTDDDEISALLDDDSDATHVTNNTNNTAAEQNKEETTPGDSDNKTS